MTTSDAELIERHRARLQREREAELRRELYAIRREYGGMDGFGRDRAQKRMALILAIIGADA